MKISDRIHLVGSGRLGFDLTEPYDCHVYLINGGSEYALIDSGAGLAPDLIIDRIVEDGLDLTRVKYLLLTHVHADHAGGAAWLRERLELTVVASKEAAAMIRNGDEKAISIDAARRAGAYPADYQFPACSVDIELVDSNNLVVGDLELTALETPGHASGQLSFVMRHENKVSVFTGDTIFAGGRILLQDIWDCSLQQSCRSIERLAALNIDGLYPGHLAFSVQRGRQHVEKAMDKIRQLLPPDQLT
jgi:glyoxylase-like metal-dependent hydrolase (beta-lactamase superfamily II)